MQLTMKQDAAVKNYVTHPPSVYKSGLYDKPVVFEMVLKVRGRGGYPLFNSLLTGKNCDSVGVLPYPSDCFAFHTAHGSDSLNAGE